MKMPDAPQYTQGYVVRKDATYQLLNNAINHMDEMGMKDLAEKVRGIWHEYDAKVKQTQEEHEAMMHFIPDERLSTWIFG
jgi:replication initiation and membrane attachment protein DnaB